MNIFITGANRGLGLGFVRHYLAQGMTVWACYRSNCNELERIKHSCLHYVQWDVRNESPERGGLPDDIDILINNAGIYGPKKKQGQTLESVTSEVMHDVFDVDCLGALRVSQKLLPNIKKNGGVIANISSKMASVTDNSSGGCYAYRAAKGALLVISKSMAVDLAPQGIHVLSLHPGWVRTDMTGQQGLIDIDASVAGMTDVIARASDYPLGSFVSFDGQLIPL